MTWIEQFHDRYVIRHRAWVLSHHLIRMLPPDARVLDVGCGDGLIASLISKERPDLKLLGVEVRVRERTAIPVELFDGERLPFDDASVDAAMLIDVLHHADHPTKLLSEAVRVAPGAVVIKDHLVEGLFAEATLRFMDGIGNRRWGVALPHKYWTRAQWELAFESLNLAVDQWNQVLRLYPWPATLIFDRSLHFAARVSQRSTGSNQE